jgi:pimeloyl-ACP methyl ester carboxylesterase
MVSQTRALLEQYKSNGGAYQELVYADCGHAPHIEKAEAFQQALWTFVG